MAGIFGDVLGFIDSGRAAKSVSNSDIAAEHGVLGATADGQNGIASAINTGTANVNAAGANVNDAANAGNNTIASLYNDSRAALNPALASGAQGNTSLQAYAASNPQFNFDPSKYINSPGYNFQLQQGQDAIENTAAAQGLSQSGKVLTDLTKYGQGLASTYYNDAFNQAQGQFQTNQNTTLSNLQALIGSGQAANNTNANLNTTVGSQMSGNLTSAAGTNASLQTYLAGLGVQGQESSGQLGLQGANSAGNFAVGAGNANASGIIGQGSALSGGISNLAGLASPLVGSIPLGGGNATTLAGLAG